VRERERTEEKKTRKTHDERGKYTRAIERRTVNVGIVSCIRMQTRSHIHTHAQHIDCREQRKRDRKRPRDSMKAGKRQDSYRGELYM